MAAPKKSPKSTPFMGDYFGHAVKNPMAKPREIMGETFKVKKVKRPPRTFG